MKQNNRIVLAVVLLTIFLTMLLAAYLDKPEENSLEMGPFPIGNVYADIYVGETQIVSRSDVDLMVTIYLNEELDVIGAALTVVSVHTENTDEWLSLAENENTIITIVVPEYSPLVSGIINLEGGSQIIIPETVGLAAGPNVFSGGLFSVYSYDSVNPFFYMEIRKL